MTDKIRAALATSAERLRELGFCPECNTAPSMDEEGPFSSCLCGTGEDYGKRPLQRLQLLERQASRATPAPIDMILHCPECHVQHIDEPETHEEFHGDGGPVEVAAWTNPPHRSHLCHNCGTIWRPADVPTNGVAAIKTAGKADRRATPALPQGVLDYGYSELFWAIAAAVEKTEPNVPRKISVRAFKEKLLSAPIDGIGSGTALPQGMSYGFLHVLDNTEGLSGNRPEIQHSFSATSPFGRPGIDYDASFAHHVITLDRALHRQALPQGVEEWIADNWWCPIHNDEECDCSTGFVPADSLQAYLSGMAIVPVMQRVTKAEDLIDSAFYFAGGRNGLVKLGRGEWMRKYAIGEHGGYAVVGPITMPDFEAMLAPHTATAAQEQESI